MADDNMTTAGRIAETIGERIISGALHPDAPLRQDHVAREFNSSHVPVREAFRQLEAQYLVVGVPRRGVRVAPLDGNSVKARFADLDAQDDLSMLAASWKFPMPEFATS